MRWLGVRSDLKRGEVGPYFGMPAPGCGAGDKEAVLGMRE